MKKLLFTSFVLIFVYGFAGTVSGNEAYKSLRGATDIPADSTPSVGMDWKPDKSKVDRTFVHQPPLIPHAVNEYQVTTAQNDCLDCHGESGADAPMPHASHYLDRDDKKSETVSSRWYFCSQCHVGQVDAQPLVENTFQAK